MTVSVSLASVRAAIAQFLSLAQTPTIRGADGTLNVGPASRASSKKARGLRGMAQVARPTCEFLQRDRPVPAGLAEHQWSTGNDRTLTQSANATWGSRPSKDEFTCFRAGLLREPTIALETMDWFYKATNASLDLDGTLVLAERHGFLCRSARNVKGHWSSNVRKVRLGDTLHVYYSADGRPQALGAFEVIGREQHPTPDVFGHVVPETALFTVDRPAFLAEVDPEGIYQPDRWVERAPQDETWLEACRQVGVKLVWRGAFDSLLVSA